MKPFLYILILAALTLSSCKKDDSLADLIVGKWTLTSAYNSGGTVGTYVAVSTHPIVKFNNDGTLSGDAFPGYSTYKVSQSSMIFTGASGSVTYGYSFPDNTLQLNQVGCTGGCGQRFVKVP